MAARLQRLNEVATKEQRSAKDEDVHRQPRSLRRNHVRDRAVTWLGGIDFTMSALPDVSQSTFQKDVLASDQPVLVDFWAPWCGPCRMLSPVVEKVATAHEGRVKFVKLNTDENPSLAGEYHVSGIPCLILFKGGQAVDRVVGFVPENQISSVLAKHLAAA